MKKITVFTPTYNRAYTLIDLYESLLNQTCSDFLWLIIDDGSSDNTKSLVESWQNEKKIEIYYISQKNMGMVSAHNTAHMNINTELCICIDSDDLITKDAVENIIHTWNEHEDNDSMGIIGLDVYKSGKVIGDTFPPHIRRCTFSELIHKYKVKGDKKYVLRTEYVKKVLPFPYVENEKYPAPSYIYLMLENDYDFILTDDVYCIVEYLEDGNSFNKNKQYLTSPNAFALYRLLKIEKAYDYKDRFRNAIHYVSSKLIGDFSGLFKDTKYKATVFLAFPLGCLLYIYLVSGQKGLINKGLNK
jgi:glycosyltransferase involved in cell wall biosynthesis